MAGTAALAMAAGVAATTVDITGPTTGATTAVVPAGFGVASVWGYVVIERQPQVVYTNPQPVYSAPVPARQVQQPVIYPRNGQSTAQIDADADACSEWAGKQVNATSDASVFQRGTQACMDARGYTVR